MQEIICREIPLAELDLIRPLWEELNAHHTACSTYFRECYERFTFEARAAMLQKKAESGKIRIEIAEDGATGTPVAYCIATIAQDGTGEIESIVVTKKYRLKGIGSRLMQGALDWFGRKNADPEIVMVAVGNENVSGFYEQYGFLPRRVMLQRKKE